MKEKKNFTTENKKIKKIIKLAKEKKLIKSHVEAFEETSVKEEKHNGKIDYFY